MIVPGTAMVVEWLELRTLLSSGNIVIDGDQPIALDVPTIHAILQTTPGGPPLLGDDPDTGYPDYYDIQGYFDTGTSGLLLDSDFASEAGVAQTTYDGQTVTYNDTGLAGGEGFGVSSPLTISLASSTAADDTRGAEFGIGEPPPDLDQYTTSFNNLRLEISRDAVDPLEGPLDIFGMPTMQGQVLVMDPTPTNDESTMSTFVYAPGTPFDAANADTDPGIPSTNLHVKLTYASFDQFASLTPAGAPGPAEDDNPFIGPNPLNALLPDAPFDNTPPVTMTNGSDSASGSFLFDTGAQASFVSQAIAAQLGVYYAPGTYNTDDAELVDADGDPIDNQFQIPIEGVGGSVTAAGFYMDSLTIPTIEGPGITFTDAPVLVTDVSVTNPTTDQSLTLDGDFGVNFFAGSTTLDLGDFAKPAALGASPLIDIGPVDPTPFDWVTFDQPNGILGFDDPGVSVTPWPTAAATASDLTSGGGSTYSFTVSYSATSGQTLSSATFGNNNILVTGPHGFSQLASEVSVSQPGNGAARTVTYQITPPGGTWGAGNGGDYIINMQPNQVGDSAGDFVRAQPLAMFSIAIAPSTIASTSGNDTFYVRVDPQSVYTEVFVNTPTTGDPTYLFSPTAMSGISISGGGGNDSATVDFSLGNPLPSGGLSFDGGVGTNSLNVIGDTASDNLTIDASQLIFNDTPIAYANTQAISIASGAGQDVLEQLAQPGASLTFSGTGADTLYVDAGTYTFPGNPAVNTSTLTVVDDSAVTFAAPSPGSGITAQTLAGLTIGSNATAVLLNAASTADRTVLVLGNLSESALGKLDLGKNDMIVHNGTLGFIVGKLKSGLNLSSHGYWNGNGITSSAAAAASNTALGVEMNANGSGAALVSTFDGQGVINTDVLVKYTFWGDANLDGVVNGSDYSLIDNGFNNKLTNWRNGDFNYDGAVNGDDYTLIDNAFNTQNALPLAVVSVSTFTGTTSSPTGHSSAPVASDDDSEELKKRRKHAPAAYEIQ